MEEITIVDVKPQKVLGMRKKGRYTDIAEMIPALCQQAVKENAVSGPPVFVCHEMSLEDVEKANKEGSADLEVAIPISGKIVPPKEMKVYEMAGGKMAKIVHKGPYQECSQAYEKLFGYVKENKKKIAGLAREVYVNDPMKVSSDELLTEIYLPIK